MNRLLRKKTFFSVLASIAAVSLTACGGGSHSSALTPSAPVSSTAPGTPYTGPLADATFKITIPVPSQTSGKARRPAYVSSATTKIVFTLNSDTVGLSGAPLATFNSTNLGAKAVTLGSATCPGSGPWTCTLSIKLPPGTDNVTMSAQDASSNILSQQIQNFTVVAAAANSFSTTLDANANTITVSGTGACTAGPVGSSFGSVGTSPANFTVAYTDAQNKLIVPPGLPLLQIQGNDGNYHSDTGTINGTGGTVSFTINQSSQTFTLTPSNSSTINAQVNVKAAPASASDGLTFAKSQSFAFSTGPAPPSKFLAVIEQLGTNSGRVDLYTANLGASDSFMPYTVSGGGTSLAVTNSTNENKPDVDNPRDITFDLVGNLLIANGGQGGAIVAGSADYGDFACVPAGAIATGSTTTTTSSANAFDPESIEIGTDSSVAIGNVPASAADNVVAYTLGTSYTPAPVARDIVNPGGSSAVGTEDVIALPSPLPLGSYAASITNGTTISRIAIKSGSAGTETDITDASIVDPHGIGYDVVHGQLVITTFNGTASNLVFYDITGSPTKKKSIRARDDGAGNSYIEGDKLAVSSDGHIAVAGITGDGPPEVQVYQNNSGITAPTAVGGPIPFDSYSNSGCTAAVYGTAPVVTSLRWLTATKLLVTLESKTKTSVQGVYTFDVGTLVQTPGLYEYDVNSGNCNSVGMRTSPKQTGFLNFNINPPLSAAYNP